MREIVFFLFGFFLSISIVFYTLLLNVHENPITTSYQLENEQYQSLFPQGWAFFTRSPKEFQLSLYEISEAKYVLIDLKNAQAKQYFGLNKSNRIVHHKLIQIAREIPNEHWVPYSERINNINIDSVNEYKLKSHLKELPTGKYLIKTEKPLAWTWFSTLKPVIVGSPF